MSLITPDFGLLFWMTLIFVFVFILLAKFGFPMITGSVAKRSDRINASIATAKEAEQKLATLSQQQEQMILETRLEQARILKEASETRDAIISQAKAQASEEAAKLLEHAKLEIAAERESAIRDIRKEVASISVQVAEKIVRGRLESKENQMSLIDKLVEEAANTRLN